MKEQDEAHSSTRISLHSLKNLLGNQQQSYLFEEQDKEFAEQFDVKLMNSIDRFGIDLTDLQAKVMEGILKGLSQTDYKGNITPEQVESISQERYSGKLPEIYKYVQQLPRLRATQSELLDWAGINRNSIACIARALEALNELSLNQFCFYYERLAYSKEGIPEKTKEGRWKKEQVVAVDTLFTVKKIIDSNTNVLSYYEITPSVIFLDQIDSYFILVPYKWREEVRSLVGNKKSSAYTFRFLLFLRYQYELKRRALKTDLAYQLKWTPEEIAIALKMPETVYKRKKDRMHSLLEDVYSVAKTLGYITDYSRLGPTDTLILNNQKYSMHKDLLPTSSLAVDLQSKEYELASALLKAFSDCRKKQDPHYHLSTHEENLYLLDFIELLKNRTSVEINQLIEWSMQQEYWSNRLATPSKLRKYFSEALVTYSLAKQPVKEQRFEENKKWAQTHLAAFESLYLPGTGPYLLILNKYVEIGYGIHGISINYEDKEFQNLVKENIKKHKLSDIKI